MKHPELGSAVGREDTRAESRPDLIKDDEMLAISLVKEPIRFIEFERERGEWCSAEWGRRLDQ